MLHVLTSAVHTVLPFSRRCASSYLIPCGQGFVVECSHVTEFQGANNVKLNVKLMMVLEGQFFPSLIIAF